METRTDVTKDIIKGYAEQLMAILVLEFHDKNFLYHGTRPKELNESKRELVQHILDVCSKP